MVDFCQMLRREGLDVSTSETLDAVQCLLFIDPMRYDLLYDGFKVTLAKKPEHFGLFDRLFDEFWGKKDLLRERVEPEQRSIHFPSKNNERNPAGRTFTPKVPREERGIKARLQFSRYQRSSNEDEVPRGEEKPLAIYSPFEIRSKKELLSLARGMNREEAVLLRRGLRTFATKMATEPGRRSIKSKLGTPDFRKTMRESLESGGLMSEIVLSVKKISKTRLVFLCDISGSMDLHADEIVKLVYYSCNTIRKCEIFAFSTQLIRLTPYIRGRSMDDAKRSISENVDIWSSGTRIGFALSEMLLRYSSFLRPTTVLVILSDGWELGDLELLKEKLAEIKRRVAAIVWLNPQADSTNYEPLASGMKIAMPFLDAFGGFNLLKQRREFLKVFGKSTTPILRS